MVTKMPTNTDTTRFRVAFSKMMRKLSPAAFFKPLDICIMPYKNRPTPPSSANTSNIDIVCSYSHDSCFSFFSGKNSIYYIIWPRNFHMLNHKFRDLFFACPPFFFSLLHNPLHFSPFRPVDFPIIFLFQLLLRSSPSRCIHFCTILCQKTSIPQDGRFQLV